MNIKLSAQQFPIFPGEYLPAYIARLFNVLQVQKSDRFFAFNSSISIGKTNTLVPKVALNFAYEHDELTGGGALIASHLNARFWRGFLTEEYFKSALQVMKSSPKSTKRIFQGEETLAPLKTLKWCPDCQKEDLEVYGVGIWYAAHQLPTSKQCAKHQTQLYQFIHSEEAPLIKHPVILQDVMAASTPVLASELEIDLCNWSNTLLSTPSNENRQWIEDIKHDLNDVLKINKRRNTLNHEWFKYLNLIRWGQNDTNSIFRSTVNQRAITPNKLLRGNTNVHPLYVLILMSFAQEHTNFRVER